MSMYSNLIGLTASFIIEREVIHGMNEQKANEAAFNYFDAAKYPRKKKKQEKKKALAEYSFWKGLAKWEEEMGF